MPVSIPGMPVESPAGGVKPPQYFAPGVAGDHGEPIAMFFWVGGYLSQRRNPVVIYVPCVASRRMSSAAISIPVNPTQHFLETYQQGQS
jgi:hypothetical protein